MNSRRILQNLGLTLILVALASGVWLAGEASIAGSQGLNPLDPKGLQLVLQMATCAITLAGGLAAIGLSLYRGAKDQKWNPLIQRVPSEPENRDAPWRQIDWNFDTMDTTRVALVRDDTGIWRSPWTDQRSAPGLRIRAHELLLSQANWHRYAFYCSIIVISAAAMLATFFDDSPWWRQFPLLALILSIGPLLRVIIAFIRLREVRAGDLSGIGHSRDDVHFELFLARQGFQVSKTMAIGLVALYFAQGSPTVQDAVLGGGDFLKAWSVNRHAIQSGEAWRLLSGTLLHGNLLHIGFNAYALFILGKIIEPILGRARLVLCYLGGLYGGSLASFLLLPENTPSVGASGAILGLLGAGLALELRAPGTLPKNLRFGFFATAVLMALLGLLGSGIIDNAGHFGGVVGGALFTLALTPRDFSRRPRREWIALALVLLYTAFLFSPWASPFFRAL